MTEPEFPKLADMTLEQLAALAGISQDEIIRRLDALSRIEKRMACRDKTAAETILARIIHDQVH